MSKTTIQSPRMNIFVEKKNMFFLRFDSILKRFEFQFVLITAEYVSLSRVYFFYRLFIVQLMSTIFECRV